MQRPDAPSRSSERGHEAARSAGGGEARAGASTAAGLLAIVVLALLVRIGAFALDPPTRLVGDEIYYAEVARNLRAGAGHVYVELPAEAPAPTRLQAWRPPGQAFWLTATIGPAPRAPTSAAAGRTAPLAAREHPPAAALAQQIALGALLAGLVALLGRRLVDARTGWLAGLAAALHPELVGFSAYLWSEMLFGALLTLGLVLAGGWQRTRRPARAMAVGLAFGAAALVREVALGALGVLAIAGVLGAAPGEQRRRAIAHVALGLAVAGALVVPWAARNQQRLGRPVGISTIGWFAAAEGNTFEPGHWLAPEGPLHARFRAQYFSIDGELARMDFARRWTLDRIAEAGVWWLPRKLARSSAQLFSPDSYVLFKRRIGAHTGPPGDPPLALSALLVAAHVGLVALAALGLACVAPAVRRLALGLLAVPLLVHVLANAATRFRIPWLPIALVLAAQGALALRDGRAAGALRARSGRLCLGTALVLLAWGGLYFARIGGRQ